MSNAGPRNTSTGGASQVVAALFALLLMLRAAQGLAQDDDVPPAGTLWNGTHVGVGVFGGPAFPANDRLRDGGGYAVGARATAAFPMQVAHLELFYTHTELTASALGDAYAASANALGATLGLHPFFLANLLASRVGYVLASLYVGVGASLAFTSSDWRGDGLDESGELGFHLGAGLDIPLDSADDGQGWWAGFQYLHNRVPSTSPALGTDEGLESHVLLFSIGYRVNALPLF